MGDKSVMLMPGEVVGAQAELMRQVFGRGSATRSGGRRKRKRRSSKSSGKARRAKSGMRTKSRTSKRRSNGGKLKKGSPEAKRFMARLRKMRRK